MTSWMRALPALERCDRPTRAPASADGSQPGRLAQGPEEKQGFWGRSAGSGHGASWFRFLQVTTRRRTPRRR